MSSRWHEHYARGGPSYWMPFETDVHWTRLTEPDG
jgi:hypothetical protein